MSLSPCVIVLVYLPEPWLLPWCVFVKVIYIKNNKK